MPLSQNELGTSTPRFSIVTPSFNQAKFVPAALLSVKAQNYRNVEHIVIDGASTDGSVEILRTCSRQPGWDHLQWVSEPDRGQSDALNKGFHRVTGDIVGWLNSDDCYRPECFRKVVSAFERHPNADVIYGDYNWIDEVGTVFQVRREIAFSYFVLLYHRVLYIPSTATFFRRRIIDDGNFIDPSFHFAMDYEFFLRLAFKGYRFKHISGILADFRWQPNSKTSLAATKQLEEQNRAVLAYSRPLQRSSRGRNQLLKALRLAAGVRRYVEKAARGYYVTQFKHCPR